MGIRLNRRAPDISFKKKKTGGVGFNSVVPLTKVDEKMCLRVLAVSRYQMLAASSACLTVSGLAAPDLMSSWHIDSMAAMPGRAAGCKACYGCTDLVPCQHSAWSHAACTAGVGRSTTKLQP